MILSDTAFFGEGDNRLFRLFESVPGFMRRDFTEHHHTAFELSLICSGAGIYRIGDKEVEIHVGDLFFFGTNEVHCITDVFPGEEMRLLNLHFEPRFLWSMGDSLTAAGLLDFFPEQSGRIPSRMPTDLPLTAEIADILRLMREEAHEKKKAYELMMETSLLKILVLLVRAYSDKAESSPRHIRPINFTCIGNSLDYINRNLSTPLSLEKIAASAGMSRTYFCSVFKKLNGLTPWEYIGIKRIEKAQNDMRTTEKTILEIAYECGFNNISHFNRLFRKTTGQNPSEYRKNI